MSDREEAEESVYSMAAHKDMVLAGTVRAPLPPHTHHVKTHPSPHRTHTIDCPVQTSTILGQDVDTCHKKLNAAALHFSMCVDGLPYPPPHAATTPPRSGVKRGCTGSPRITAEQPPRVRQRREAAALFDKDEREALAIGRAHFMVENAGVPGDRHKLAALLRDMEKALILAQEDITLHRRVRRLDALVTWKLAQEADPTPAMLAYRNGRDPEEQLQFLENQEYALIPPLGTYRVLMLPQELLLHRDDADAPPPAKNPEKLATAWMLDDPMGAKRDAQYKSDWWHLDRYHASDQYKYDCGYWARP
jgi:hypothetical protein